jgi:putative colanic acid biosysnthesis UDP-glucose lipid carrier transferase
MNTKPIATRASDSRALRTIPHRVLAPPPTTPAAKRLANPWAIRAFDVLLASLLLVALAAPMLFLAVLVKLTSRGPVLYRQERTGRGGRSFELYKFRTMSVDAETAGRPAWTRRGDPRRTTVGILLRRFSLDELPQLVNVLQGNMSLVGPRPERPHFVRIFSQTHAGYAQRHQVPPGITGWAQVNGWRGDTSIEKRLEHDLYYVRHRSLRFNLWILLLTPLRVLFDQNAG